MRYPLPKSMLWVVTGGCYFHSFCEWAYLVIKNTGCISRKGFSAEYLKLQRQRLYFGCMLWYSWEIQTKILHLKIARTRTWKASRLTHLYGYVASAQSMYLFNVFLLSFKQLRSQIIYVWNNEALYEPLMTQIQATVSWMVLWWLELREVQCGGTNPLCWLSRMPLIGPLIPVEIVIKLLSFCQP